MCRLQIFDAFVVIISFTLDVTFTFVSVSSAASDAAGLMVLLRLWRVTRIINGEREAGMERRSGGRLGKSLGGIERRITER